ncbi:MAG: sugar kinase [Chloroflexi bacterium]|nr:sugar kinase [Chloroflexota bacterium]
MERNTPNMDEIALDVLALGETMLRFTPFDYLPLESAQSLQVHIGGSESNMLVGLARLGMNVAWLSRLTRNGLGRHIVNGLRAHGVDTRHVVWTDEDRVGLYFLEEGSPPRASRVTYDRKDSAMARMRPEHLPADLFAPGKARLFHTCGITAAIGDDAAATAAEAIRLAKAAGWLVSFDFNYRANLWSAEAARQGCDPLAAQADVVFIPLRDAVKLFGTDADPTGEGALNALHTRYPGAIVVVTLAANGAAAMTPDGQILRRPAVEVTPIARLGTGDSFVAGFLYGWLTEGIEAALPWGTAAAAWKMTLPGDMGLLDRAGVADLVKGGGGKEIRR